MDANVAAAGSQSHVTMIDARRKAAVQHIPSAQPNAVSFWQRIDRATNRTIIAEKNLKLLSHTIEELMIMRHANACGCIIINENIGFKSRLPQSREEPLDAKGAYRIQWQWCDRGDGHH